MFIRIASPQTSFPHEGLSFIAEWWPVTLSGLVGLASFVPAASLLLG